jgi:ATP-dependent DNA helicase recG
MLEITTNIDSYVIKGNIPNSLKNELPTLKEKEAGLYTCPLLPYSSFVLACFCLINKNNVKKSKEAVEYMKSQAKECAYPTAFLDDRNKGQVFIEIPTIPAYRNLLSSMSAKHRRLNIYSVPQSRLYEFYRTVKNWKHPFLPSIVLSEELGEYISADLSISKDVENLFKISPYDLYSIEYGWNMNIEKAIKKLKWASAGDLILTRPRKYEDRTKIIPTKNAQYGKEFTFKVEFLLFLESFDRKKIRFQVRDCQTHEIVDCQMFGGFYYKQKLRNGDILHIVASKIQGGLNVTNILYENEVEALPIAPVYNASPSNGFNSRVITNCTNEILERFDGSELFSYIRGNDNFWESVKSLHFPKSVNDYDKCIDNLAFHELVCLQLLFIDRKMKNDKKAGIPKVLKKDGLFEEALRKLPFDLTVGQKEAIQIMKSKFSTNEPVDALLSGDVGSGKSMIATLLALFVVDNNQQVVIVGPTEVLANQLYDSVMNVVKTLDNKPTVDFISGSLKASELKHKKKDVKEGKTDIIIGTHSVFNLEYKNLGFVIIDEQQKFGAEQRDKLKDNGRNDGKIPDVLSQTATPIPRSTAQAFYGDIDLIQVTDKPAGRKEIITEWIKEKPEDVIKDKNSRLWSLIRKETNENNQIFIICPAVEDNDESDFMNVKKTQKLLDKVNKGIAKSIHGKMSKKKQQEVIEEFKNQEFPILIGSSILEVGINIPQATVMIVLDADRFGASSLHQIRGRVGRNDLQSYCLLVSNSETESAKVRLSSLVDSNNGFDIALADLKTRKEGDMLGIRQSGESTLRFCNLIDHSELIDLAKSEANRIYSSSLKNQAINDANSFLIKQED